MDNQEVFERYQAGAHNFEGVNLRGAHLNGFDLRDASLRQADLRGADLSDANLSRADLKRANLRGANLRHAFLEDADLRLVDLADADLRGASLEGADLHGANLSRSLLDKNTEMADRWRQVWELLDQKGNEQVSSLQVETRIKPEGGTRAELLVDGEPLTGGPIGVSLHQLALTLQEGGEYWIFICPSCGTPGCSGITRSVNVSRDVDQVKWVIFQPGPARAAVFHGHAYREAIRQGLRHFVACCRQHPGGWMERLVNYNYYLVDANLDKLLGDG